MAKNSKSNLERIFRKSEIRIENLSLPMFGLGEIADAQKDFAITISKMNFPCILVSERHKRADTYFPRAFKQKLSAYKREYAKKIIGQYREAINALRRHDYKINLSEVLGPWDDKNENSIS